MLKATARPGRLEMRGSVGAKSRLTKQVKKLQQQQTKRQSKGRYEMLKKTLLTMGFALGLSAAAHAETFVFTAIPDQDESALRTRFGKIATYLQGKLGVDVKYVPVKSYAAAVTAFRNDQVQLAWFGGLSGVRARSLVKGSHGLPAANDALGADLSPCLRPPGEARDCPSLPATVDRGGRK